MSTGVILAVLSNIPWGQVIENAPKVADGAAKLWNSVTGFRKKTLDSSQIEVLNLDELPSERDVLKTKVQALEEAVKTLEDQMQSSSELIKALADQNTQLVQRIELNRVRLYFVTVFATSFGLVLFAAVGYLALHQ